MKPRDILYAHILPFAVFLAGIALIWAVQQFAGPNAPLLLAEPMYWVYPLQTVVCGAALLWFWRSYDFGPVRPVPLGIVAGLVALVVWICPQVLFGADPRVKGFDPGVFDSSPALYWLAVFARFARLVIIVPLVEEIFWRGFLMRYLIREDFQNVAFGTFSRLSFFGVAGLFMLEHSTPDWPAALFTGLLYNAVAVKTRSLLCCVIAHAITNFGLGLYIMATRQWGFW